MKGNIVKTLFKLESGGRAVRTIRTMGDYLFCLAGNADLDDPGSVKFFVARGVEEAFGLVDAGFEYVCDFQGWDPQEIAPPPMILTYLA